MKKRGRSADPSVTSEMHEARGKLLTRAIDVIYAMPPPEPMELLMQGIGLKSYLLAKATATIIRDSYEELKVEVPAEAIVPTAMETLDVMINFAVHRAMFEVDDALIADARQRLLMHLAH